jgi:hypothetical protein
MVREISDTVTGFRAYGVKSFAYNALSILASDYVVVSFQKCGKTWLRMMLSKVLMDVYGIKKQKLDLQFMTLLSRAPNILISHAGSTKFPNKIDFVRLFKHKKIVFLVRDPRDIIVSLFHSARTREKIYEGSELSTFIRDERYGFHHIIEFLNRWSAEMKRRPHDFLMVKYEDLKKDAASQLRRILDFVHVPASDDAIKMAVDYGSFENMRKLEMAGAVKDYRMQSGDVKDPNSFRTRKGKVGGYIEEMSPSDVAYVTSMVKEKLDPDLGYS